ncbi:hypothetical protein C5688_13290 [Methylocystis sp. MitZ-2018]|nr:hypothetical protein C5688_13290 [Methylocystis sp. MitZ-2018]
METKRPFPGLRPFYYRDRGYFFGRQEQIYALYRLIDRSRFVAVVGSSGSGKSSLVRAGLLPLLDEETNEEGARNWKCALMRPGDSPIARLASAFSDLAPDEDEAVVAIRRERIAFDLRRSSFGMSEALGKVAGLDGHSLLLVVDQFEELFRFAADEAVASPRESSTLSREEAAQFVQLLIEGARTTVRDVHIIITMRSDFIGDCARFHGLPEAVSGAQFLVPALTRDQLEEVICKPLDAIGGSIDPTLVERLLNDSNDDRDQLPVLQHCLLRLWERAGIDPQSNAAPAAAAEDADFANHNAGGKNGGGRRLTLAHYVAIGGLRKALSQHADEILADLSDVTLAVEQTFRALSEMDREGRAIRRALPFWRLVAETGFAETALRRIVNRFRGDDCSFLTPSPRDVSTLVAETRIDVSHEALLRRWERISGNVDEPGSPKASMKRGWLAEEERDGRIYRGLLTLLDSEGRTDPVLPLGLVEERWAWWNSCPRTPEWAERYGGSFKGIQRLLAGSLDALKADVRRTRRDMVFMGAAFVAIAGLLGLWLGQARKNEQAYLEALKSSVILAKEIVEENSAGRVTADGFKNLLSKLESASSVLSNNARSEGAKALSVELKLGVIDALYSVGRFADALRDAQNVNELTTQLIAAEPGRDDWRQLRYGSLFRVADAQSALKQNDEALQNYIVARNIAEDLAKKNFEFGAKNLVFIENKIGETLQAQTKYGEAADHFLSAEKLAERLATESPDNVAAQRLLASTSSKIATLLLSMDSPDGAGAATHLDKAIYIFEQLVAKNLSNDGILSNLAMAQSSKAKALSFDDPRAAIDQYKIAIATREPLLNRSGGTFGLLYQARDYERLADLYENEKIDDKRKALDAMRNSVKLRKLLVDKDPKGVEWQKKFADARAKMARLEGALHHTVSLRERRASDRAR